MPRAWRRRAVPLGEALREVARAIGIEGSLQEVDVLRVWPRAVGSMAAEHARPASLRGGTLVVHVTDSAWLHRLSMARRDILRDVNDLLGVALLKSVRLRIGPLEGAAAAGCKPAPPPARPLAERSTHGAVDDAALVRAMAPVKDLPFGDVVHRILYRQAGLRRRA